MPKTECLEFPIIGDGAIPAAAVGVFPWTSTVVGAAPPTVNYLAEVVNILGGAEIALTAASQAQTAALTWGDSHSIDLDMLYYFEWLARFTVLPTAAVEAVMGLASEYNAVPDTVAESIWFKVDANVSSSVVVLEWDDVTNTADDQSSQGLAMTVNLWYRFGIAFKETVGGLADIYMFASRTGSSGDTSPQRFARWGDLLTIRLDGYATAARGVQPFFALYKPSGTGVGTMQIASPMKARISNWL